MIVSVRNRPSPPAGTELLVAGEVDTYAADELREHLRSSAVPPSGVVVVDLAGVTFMSCTALAVLAEARRRLGPRLVLGGTSRAVSRLLDITGLSPCFPVRAANRPVLELDGHGAGDGRAPAGADTRAWTFSRADIERACARLVSIHGCDREQAWDMLARASARHGVPVGELVELLIRPPQNRDRPPSPAAARALVTVLMRVPAGDRPTAGLVNP